MKPPARLDRTAFAAYLGPERRIYLPGGVGQSPLFQRWLKEVAAAARGSWFCGVWIPNFNRFDPTALDPGVRATTFFPGGACARESWARGALEILPLRYSEIVGYLRAPVRFDVALLHVAPPDAAGRCSLSVSADFSGIVAAATSGVVLAHVNPRLPRTEGPWVHVGRFAGVVEEACEPLTMPEPSSDPVSDAIAARVAGEIRDGDTVQVGLGKLGSSVWRALRGHSRLRVYSGLVTEGVLGLAADGALAQSADGPPITAGVALGSESLYAALSDPTLCRFAEADVTHAASELAKLHSLASVNSALQIDLRGQVNGERIDGLLISGIGGMADYARAAQASEDGRSVIMLPSSTAQGQSRIVPMLPEGSVTLASSDADIFCTEHGTARTRHLGMDERARAIIAIAAPAHRADLERDWRALRARF